jgi:hypothetical protein
MENNFYCVYEFGALEFWGNLEQCRQYIAANEFKDSFYKMVQL